MRSWALDVVFGVTASAAGQELVGVVSIFDIGSAVFVLPLLPDSIAMIFLSPASHNDTATRVELMHRKRLMMRGPEGCVYASATARLFDKFIGLIEHDRGIFSSGWRSSLMMATCFSFTCALDTFPSCCCFATAAAFAAAC